MSSFYQLLDKQVDETEIDITDFSKYHRHTFNDQQDSLSIRTVKELNNLRYTEFENKYLIPFSKNGKIKNGDATLMWIVYEDMKEVLNTYDNKTKFRLVDKQLAEFWINEFTKKSIRELWEYGPNVISSGFGIVIDYFREWFVEQKYERIFSKGKTFEDFVELTKKNYSLLKGEEMPFDLQSIREKSEIIIKMRN